MSRNNINPKTGIKAKMNQKMPIRNCRIHSRYESWRSIVV